MNPKRRVWCTQQTALPSQQSVSVRIDSDFQNGNLTLLASHHGKRNPLTIPQQAPRTASSALLLLQAYPYAAITMPGPKNTLLIEGSFEELTDEFAQYIDSLKKSQGDEASNLQGESADLLKENKKDEVLKKLVVGSQALNQAPEKGMNDMQ